MIGNYFKITFRTLQKTKLFSTINILGLAIGMVACLLILHYITFEKSYDSFHSKADQIYRLRYERISEDGSAVRFASCTPPAGNLIRQRFPEIGLLTRIFRYRTVIVSHEDTKFTEERVFHAEPSFVDIFDFNFIQGDPRKALGGVNAALISQSMAKKYFGADDPLGKIIRIDQKTDYQVAGIFRDVPANSHLKFDFLLSFENFSKSSGPDYMENWGHTGMYTYLMLKPGTGLHGFEKKLENLVETEFGEALRDYHMEMILPLQPLRDIHLNSHYMQEFEVSGDRESVNFLYIIALFIIVIAWVNYINLSTARSLTRAKEVALRKTVGGSRQQLIMQFFFETVVLNILSLLAALLILQILLPFFCSLTGVPYSFTFWEQPWLWWAIGALFLCGIIISGLYPVLRLSSFSPSIILRGKLGITAKGISLRKVLVVFQYIMALFLLTGTLTIYSQIDHLRTRNLGFTIDDILIVKAPILKDEHFSEKISSFKEDLLTRPDILKICVVTEVPGRHNLGLFAVKIKTEDIPATIEMIESRFNDFFPGNPFDYFFLDAYFDQQYKADIRFARIFGVFALLAIFVTCLGILGLVAFMVTQRTKEIGIRKVLGAELHHILYILTIEILKLIVLSFVILVPFIYWGIGHWLQSFASRMDYHINLFVIPLIITLAITLITIGTHVFRAANANPVTELRYE
jgi:putative ABC transport system permease protein